MVTRLVPEVQKRRVGQRTFRFPSRPVMAGWASVAGPKEGKGPLGGGFDEVCEDRMLGQSSFEQAEMRMLERAVERAVEKAGLKLSEIDLIIGGDLLNQNISLNFAARKLDRPLLGLFGACSTWCEALLAAGVLLDGGYAERIVVAVSSHHDTAERQYRFPTEFGNQRPPTAQWTATGAAAAVLVNGGSDGGRSGSRVPRLKEATIGRVVDMGVKDPFDMGSAMAPAALDTIAAHLEDTGRRISDYDRVVTGDLARVGSDLLYALAAEQPGKVEPEPLREKHEDCGVLLYGQAEETLAGGSGAACSGMAFVSHYTPLLQNGEIEELLLVATGALMSPTSYQQGESIPCIAHAVVWTGES